MPKITYSYGQTNETDVPGMIVDTAIKMAITPPITGNDKCLLRNPPLTRGASYE